MFDGDGANQSFLEALIGMFCYPPGRKEEVWQGEWKVLFYSWQAFEFVCKEKGVSFARGKLFQLKCGKGISNKSREIQNSKGRSVSEYATL